MGGSGTSVIHWFRRDLRVEDNTSLRSAAKPQLPLVPVYILSDWQGGHAWTGPNRQQFLCGSLAELSRNLQRRGSRLNIRRGNAVSELRRLATECRATAIHFNADPDPFGKLQEAAVKTMCAELGIDCRIHVDVSLFPPGKILTQSGLPYKVFTPYSRNWLARAAATPDSSEFPIRACGPIDSLPLPEVGEWGLAKPTADLVAAGEEAAKARLKLAMTAVVPRYADLRDLPAREGTSRLSQDLRWGLLSIRTVHAAALAARESAGKTGAKGSDCFIKELAWREFYFAILHYFPNVLEEEFNPVWRGLPWDEPDERFAAWKQGRTGFPIVDAGMRELAATGFMHNRVRMITAMFLTKDIHIDWKLGESWFMQHLVDGEIASNNGGWQWSAGTGADAAPYFRIQNPWSQTARFDPDGLYIKKWIPELREIAPARFQQAPPAGAPLSKDYPLPIVDHAEERARTLAIFQAHRGRTR